MVQPAAASDQPEADKADSKTGKPPMVTAGFLERTSLSVATAAGTCTAQSGGPEKAEKSERVEKAEKPEKVEKEKTEKTEKLDSAAPEPETAEAQLGGAALPETGDPGTAAATEPVPSKDAVVVGTEAGGSAKTVSQQQHDFSFAPAPLGDAAVRDVQPTARVGRSEPQPAKGSRQTGKNSPGRTKQVADPSAPVTVAAPVTQQTEPVRTRETFQGAETPADASQAAPIPTAETTTAGPGATRENAVPSNRSQAGAELPAELTAAVRTSEQPSGEAAAPTTETTNFGAHAASVPLAEEPRRASGERMIPDAAAQSADRSSQFVFRETAAGNSGSTPAPEAAAETARDLEPQRIVEPAETTAPRRPANGLSIELGQGTRERVALHVTERAGEVRVAVRTADPELAHSIRQSLPELVSHLEQSGFHAEGWQPAAAAGLNQAASRAESPATRNGDPQQQQSGWSQQDRGQRGHEQGHRPQWVEELEHTRTSAGRTSTGEWNGFGN